MRTKRFLSVIFISVFMCLCFLFTACSSNPSGVYMLEKMQVEDGNNSITINVGDTYDGVKLMEDAFTLKIEKDGTVILRERSYEEWQGEIELDEEYIRVGKWYEGIDKDYYAVFNIDGEEEVFVIKKNGKKLIFDFGYGMVATLTK